jgi:hypothetical protein
MLAIGGPLVAAGCASSMAFVGRSRYELNVRDNVDARRFDIVLKSKDEHAICISNEHWPNTSGRFTVEIDDVFVKTASGLMKAKSGLSSAYCPGGCGEHRVKPGDELKGFISYASFGDPEELARAFTRELEFQAKPYYCR